MKHAIKKYLLLVLCCAFINNGFAIIKKPPVPQSAIKFTENKSQWDNKVLYRAQLDGGVLFLEKNCFTYNFYDKETLRKDHVKKQQSSTSKKPKEIRSHAFRMTFVNALNTPGTSAKRSTPDYCNFFIGNDKSKWVGNVKNYKEVNYKNIYNGIDIQLLGMENSVKYNFIVAAQANPDEIKLLYEGLDKISIEKKSLRLKTSLNELVEEKPYAYQWIDGKKVEVPCQFVVEKTTVSFRFPKGYNKNEELIIDPVLVFACSSGSTADNFGMTATYDAAGNLYGGGTCFDQGYPVTLGVYDSTYNGSVQGGRTDVVISKYDSSGVFLQYATYIGGAAGTEIVSSLIVNSQNELMLFGATGSSDFPVTAGAFDTIFSGGPYLVFPYNGTEYFNGTDLYVAKFNSTGTTLLASTFIGGSDNDGANNSSTLAYNYGDYYRGEIQVDNADNCYIASCTYSIDFPTTGGCPQPAAGGGMDGVVFKMDNNLSAMLWSTYVGGGADDGCYALTLDNLLNIYTTGGTSSNNFPTTPGVISSTYNGGSTDGFVTKIKYDGTVFLKSTLIGTALYDQSFLIQLDNNYDVYVIGQSEGVMPISGGVYSNPNSKQFIWKMDNNLSAKLITTVFGNGSGRVNISPSAFLVDNCGNIYVCGWGGNILTGIPTTNMPLTNNALQPTTDGFNFYLFVLTPNANSLLYGTYFGGPLSMEHVDGGTSRFDKKGIVYQAVCAGCPGNDDFPVTPGSWPHAIIDATDPTDVNQSWNCNMGVFKFDFQAAGVNANAVISPNDTVCLGETINFNNASANAYNYLWDFGDGTPASTVTSPSHTYSTSGTFIVTLIAIDSSGCLFSDTSHLSIVIAPLPNINIGNDTVLCQAPNLILDAGTSGTIFNWSTGAISQTILADTVGSFWVEVSNGNCAASDTINIQQLDLFSPLGNDTTLCAGQSITLNAFVSGATYVWSTGVTTPAITVSSAGQYWVIITLATCQTKDTVAINYVPYPVVNLPANSIICQNDSLLLDAGAPASSYLWSTGATTQSVFISTPGTYFVTASNGQCSTSDTAIVIQRILPKLGNDTALCVGQPVTLNAFISGATYLWSTGETSSTITLSSAGQYWVTTSLATCQKSDTLSINYIPYPVVNLPASSIICQNDSLLLDAGAPASSYLWSTGAITQNIFAASGGTYSVTASNGQCSTSDTAIIIQQILPKLGSDTTLCAGQNLTLNVFVSGASYQWSTGTTTSSINVVSPGQYTVTITLGACQAKDTMNVNFVSKPVVNLPSNIIICPNNSFVLDAGAPATAYLWSTGDTTQTVSVSGGGMISVIVSNAQCKTKDTTIVNAVLPINWEKNSTLCNTQKFTLDAGPSGTSYLWSTGATTQSIDIIEPGSYWVVMNKSNCILSDTMLLDGGLGSGIVWFPNSFTPNANGLNDSFKGKGIDITYFHLIIFNRWGEVIFESEKEDEGWNGTYKGALVEQDVYVWKLEYKTKCTHDRLNIKIGHVTVVR